MRSSECCLVAEYGFLVMTIVSSELDFDFIFLSIGDAFRSADLLLRSATIFLCFTVGAMIAALSNSLFEGEGRAFVGFSWYSGNVFRLADSFGFYFLSFFLTTGCRPYSLKWSRLELFFKFC